MSCENPNVAVRLYTDSSTGKQKIKFFGSKNVGNPSWSVESLIAKYGSDNVLFLDCGHCPSCIKKRRKEWSIRCELEAKQYEKNVFVTLTYDDEHLVALPEKKELIEFKDKLRWKLGRNIRYFGCGEIGSQQGRAHYHIILFNYCPDDLRFYSRTKSGGYQFTSDFLSSIWKKGFVTVCMFEPGLASYVAGYVTKKLEDPDAPGFQVMSTRPGIGFQYFMNHIQDIYESDSLVTSFGSHKGKIPRYLDKLADLVALDISDVRQKRSEFAMAQVFQEARSLGCSQVDEVILNRQLSNKDKHNLLKERSL